MLAENCQKAQNIYAQANFLQILWSHITTQKSVNTELQMEKFGVQAIRCIYKKVFIKSIETEAVIHQFSTFSNYRAISEVYSSKM